MYCYIYINQRTSITKILVRFRSIKIRHIMYKAHTIWGSNPKRWHFRKFHTMIINRFNVFRAKLTSRLHLFLFLSTLATLHAWLMRTEKTLLYLFLKNMFEETFMITFIYYPHYMHICLMKVDDKVKALCFIYSRPRLNTRTIYTHYTKYVYYIYI